MHRRMKATIAAAALSVLVLASCDETTADRESKKQEKNYSQLAKEQPPGTMDYSPTRETINFWMKTWGKNPNKLSYVYLMTSDGSYIGYYVMKGLPVSYCASLTPPYDIEFDSNGNVVTPAPAMDGAFYSGQQCNSYYGEDATTGAYIEFTIGVGNNILLFDKPLPGPQRDEVDPLGETSIDDVKDKD